MTLTINPSDYAQLLAKYQPKVIETEAENDRAIELAQELEHKANRSNEEDAILELLVTLDDSKNVNAIPLYALYSSVNDLAMCQQLNHKDGIFLAGGQKIYDSFIAISRQKITANDLLGLSNPFSCFACCPLIKSRGGLQDYLRHYFLSEITPVDQEVDGFRGLHDELPTYLTFFLQNAREGVPRWWQGEFESELRDFKALLIYDFRNNDF